MIVIAIIGILAAIALPAYARYMARARFTEVTNAVAGVQKQVELCIFDLGTTGFGAGNPITVDVTVNANGCSNPAGGNSGSGWKLDQAADYATKYVATITVNENASIVTAQAVATNGLNGATYSVAPMFGPQDNGIIDWVRADGNAYGAHGPIGAAAVDMTCIDAELC